ncbi:hypothetical protein ABZX51_006282 [Aspergillus tubingensis]
MTDKDTAVMHLEDLPGHGASAEDLEFLSNFPPEAKKKVIRKVDVWCLSPFLQ